MLAENSDNPLKELSSPSETAKPIVDALNEHVSFMRKI